MPAASEVGESCSLSPLPALWAVRTVPEWTLPPCGLAPAAGNKDAGEEPGVLVPNIPVTTRPCRWGAVPRDLSPSQRVF